MARKAMIVRQRALEAVLRLAGPEGAGVFSRGDLARELGCRPTTAARLLVTLRREGLVVLLTPGRAGGVHRRLFMLSMKGARLLPRSGGGKGRKFAWVRRARGRPRARVRDGGESGREVRAAGTFRGPPAR
ncbi:helix-turn-helix domain-containing protein [Ammonifex thiophilus]|uniref:helix-turn-helix domain-containing protein n=1 Tax=Ammonifex thiophilus TaxID=444093 RepID=UPI001401CF9E|nr:helix-turn-helix domain-containing protein [Ammonifex thiophilus]